MAIQSLRRLSRADSRTVFRSDRRLDLWPVVLHALADGRWHAISRLGRNPLGRTGWRQVLRGFVLLGAPLRFDPARGVRLTHALTPLLGQVSMRTAISVERHVQLDSTNSHMLRALGRGLAHPRACLAEAQTHGRGRRERGWLAPLGGALNLSVAVPAAYPLGREALSLRVGVEVAEALRGLGARSVQIKWPNDLVAEGGKLGGILIEGCGAGVVIGIGINHHMPALWLRRIPQPVTSLARLRGALLPARERVLTAILRALHAALASCDETWRARFDRLDALRGEPVRVIEADGMVWHGMAVGVDARGALRVRVGDGERLCHAGEVSIRLEGGHAAVG